MNIPQFVICSPVNEYLRDFLYLAIINQIAVNIFVCFFVDTNFHFC